MHRRLGLKTYWTSIKGGPNVTSESRFYVLKLTSGPAPLVSHERIPPKSCAHFARILVEELKSKLEPIECLLGYEKPLQVYHV